MDTEHYKQNLETALFRIDRVFGRYEGSDDWGDGNDSSVTQRLKVHDLTDKDYFDFGWHSCFFGTHQLQGLKYFLPRVARDLSYGKQPPWDAGHLAELFVEHQWILWPVEEFQTAEAWVYAWMRYSASLGSPWESAACAGCSGVDLQEFYRQFLRDDRQLSMTWLAENIELHWQEIIKKGQVNWLGRRSHFPTREQQVSFIALLLRKSSVEMLKGAFFESEDENLRILFSKSVSHAEYCREAYIDRPGSVLAEVISRNLLAQ